jgi:hypothetical protein
MPGNRWKPISPPFAGYQEVGTASTTQKHPLGFRMTADDRPDTGASAGIAEFIYVRGFAGTLVSYAADTYTMSASAANGTTLLAATPSTADLVANTYGWAQVSGDTSP